MTDPYLPPGESSPVVASVDGGVPMIAGLGAVLYLTVNTVIPMCRALYIYLQSDVVTAFSGNAQMADWPILELLRSLALVMVVVYSRTLPPVPSAVLVVGLPFFARAHLRNNTDFYLTYNLGFYVLLLGFGSLVQSIATYDILARCGPIQRSVAAAGVVARVIYLLVAFRWAVSGDSTLGEGPLELSFAAGGLVLADAATMGLLAMQPWRRAAPPVSHRAP